jgi:anti-sigma28 factor (negative regulator of flagellin synthesis)
MEINRIGGPARPGRIEREEMQRRRAEALAGPGAQDEVQISPQARMASNIVQFSEAIKNLPEIRADRVQAARENIERGMYRVQDVVREVAARVSRYVINE